MKSFQLIYEYETRKVLHSCYVEYRPGDSASILRGRAVETAARAGRSLAGADLSRIDIEGADLSHIDFRGAYFGRSRISYSSMKGADLRGATFLRSKINNTNMNRTNLKGAKFIKTGSLGVDFRGANLEDVESSRSNFNHSQFDNQEIENRLTQGENEYGYDG